MLGTYLSLLQSTSEKPLQYWSKEKSLTGSIKRVLDGELNEYVGYLTFFYNYCSLQSFEYNFKTVSY